MTHRVCYRCRKPSDSLVLGGVRGGSRGPGYALYVCLTCVGPELVAHYGKCHYCRTPDRCDIGRGLRAALNATARLMPDPEDYA